MKVQKSKVSLNEAAALYGIPVKYLRLWVRKGGLNEYTGLIRRGAKLLLDLKLVEKRIGLRPHRKAAAVRH